MFIKCLRNKIKDFFVLSAHKMIEMVYSSLCLSIKHFLLCAALPSCAFVHCFEGMVIDISRFSIQFGDILRQLN
jgi:hypothetical protein